MKTNPIKAKDTEILVSGKGKTLDRILNKEGQSEESIPIVYINDDDIVSIIADAEYPNEAKINLKNDKTQEIVDLLGEDATKDICFIINTTTFNVGEIHASCIATVEIMVPGELFITMSGIIKLISFSSLETYYNCDMSTTIGQKQLYDLFKNLFVSWNGSIKGTF